MLDFKAGKKAYEADLAKRPTYHDGTPRPTWEKLSEVGKWSWSRIGERRRPIQTIGSKPL